MDPIVTGSIVIAMIPANIDRFDWTQFNLWWSLFAPISTSLTNLQACSHDYGTLVPGVGPTAVACDTCPRVWPSVTAWQAEVDPEPCCDQPHCSENHLAADDPADAHPDCVLCALESV